MSEQLNERAIFRTLPIEPSMFMKWSGEEAIFMLDGLVVGVVSLFSESFYVVC